MLFNPIDPQQKAAVKNKLFTTRLTLVIILILALLGGFLYLAGMAGLPNNQLDSFVFSGIALHITATNTRVMLFFTFLGSRQFLLPTNIALAIYFLLLRKQKRWLVIIPAVALATVGINLLLKDYFRRARPLGPLLQGFVGFSFPSGHAMSAFTFYGLLIYMAWHYINWPAFKWICIIALAICIFMVGVSRIYLRAHYATDVLGGFAMGAILLIISVYVLKNVEKFIGQRPTAKYSV